MIAPTIGRRLWFWMNGVVSVGGFTPHCIDKGQAFDAGVVYVWNDRMVNLDVTDHYGQHFAATSVPLVQEGEPQPKMGMYATWMPYQQQKAKEDAAPSSGALEDRMVHILGSINVGMAIPSGATSNEPIAVEEDFFVVWAPEGGSPTRRHEYEYEAINEAERLAKKNPGREFIVLHPASAIKYEMPLKRTVYEPRMPF